MATNDIIAVALLVLCGLFGLRGCFRWTSGLIVGLVVGCLILGIIGIVGSYSWSGQVGSFFDSGTIIPYIGQQIENIAHRIGIEMGNNTSPEKEEIGAQDRIGEENSELHSVSAGNPVPLILGLTNIPYYMKTKRRPNRIRYCYLSHRRWVRRGRAMADFIASFTVVSMGHILRGFHLLARWYILRTVRVFKSLKNSLGHRGKLGYNYSCARRGSASLDTTKQQSGNVKFVSVRCNGCTPDGLRNALIMISGESIV
jgi:hypothetical protein